jgi:hypothetical protein
VSIVFVTAIQRQRDETRARVVILLCTGNADIKLNTLQESEVSDVLTTRYDIVEEVMMSVMSYERMSWSFPVVVWVRN